MAAKQNSLSEWMNGSYLASGNEAYLENLYEQYLAQDATLDPKWKVFFDQLAGNRADESHAAVINEFLAYAQQKPSQQKTQSTVSKSQENQSNERYGHIVALIAAYRRLGHLQ